MSGLLSPGLRGVGPRQPEVPLPEGSQERKALPTPLSLSSPAECLLGLLMGETKSDTREQRSPRLGSLQSRVRGAEQVGKGAGRACRGRLETDDAQPPPREQTEGTRRARTSDYNTAVGRRETGAQRQRVLKSGIELKREERHKTRQRAHRSCTFKMSTYVKPNLSKDTRTSKAGTRGGPWGCGREAEAGNTE